MNESQFSAWALVELFGHQRIVGRVSEQQIGASILIRVDVPDADGKTKFTRFYGDGAIYSISPIDESVALKLAQVTEAELRAAADLSGGNGGRVKNFAHLKESSPFYRLFPGGMVPIKNIIVPNKAECIGDGVQDVYMVDVAKLTGEQLDGILDLLTASCPDRRAEARADIDRMGLPLRAKHVSSVSSDGSRFFL